MPAFSGRDSDTIAAIATPPGPGGIGIVRVSGTLAPEILQRLFRPSKPVPHFESHLLYHGWIQPEKTPSPIDECLAVLMKAPKSYTRENVVEFQCHSGPAVTRRVLEAVVDAGARIAEPGEFTLRAFLNGRIDLTQAEAVLDLVSAQTDTERSQAAMQLKGTLSDRLSGIREKILYVLANIEVAIDFPEEDVELLKEHEISLLVRNEILKPVKSLLESYKNGRVLREGARVILAGRPNVGKSSIFNALLGAGRVIVSPVPGTTRDIIEEQVEILGIRTVLVDTAGIHDDTGDRIEILGMDLAREHLNEADLALAVFDLSEPPCPEDLQVIRSIPLNIPWIPVFNKEDLCGKGAENAKRVYEREFKNLSDCGNLLNSVTISAVTGTGLDRLRELIRATLIKGDPEHKERIPDFIPNLRQKKRLEYAAAAVSRGLDCLGKKYSPEFTAVEFHDALVHIDGILGLDTSSDLLDEIFGSFCLGK